MSPDQDPIAAVQKLIELANGTTNENEARSAALQACTRIKVFKIQLLTEEAQKAQRAREAMLLERIHQLEEAIRCSIASLTPERAVDMGAKVAGSAARTCS